MKAISLAQQFVSHPSELTVSTIETPSPSPTHHLVRIHSAGVNFFDLLQIRGKYQIQPPFPWTAGFEFAGEIVATPTAKPEDGSDWRFQVGDRVFGAQQGAYATHILAPEWWMHKIPNGWSFDDAAGLYVTGPTAYAGIVTRARTKAGEWVLVHAGAGGVGLAAVQVAKAVGATVIATVGSQRKAEVARSYGADWVVDYREKGWEFKVKQICERERKEDGKGNSGIDVVFDPVGLIELSLRCVSWDGRLIVVGFAGGQIEKVAMNRVLLKNVSVIGLQWGMYPMMEPETEKEVWKGLFSLIAEKKFKSIVFSDQEFVGLDRVADALTALESRATWGKVVVRLKDSNDIGYQNLKRESRL